MHQVLDGQSISADVRCAGVRYLVEARPTPTGGFALLREADTGLLDSGLVRRNLGFALLVGVAVAVVVGLVVGHLLARPLRRTATAARTRRSGRRDVRVPESGPAEVSDVAGAVNELADALARSEERQRRFLLSVSHELRTPLTAIRGFAESIADGVVTGDGGADAAAVIVREAHRLDRWSPTSWSSPAWRPTTSASTPHRSTSPRWWPTPRRCGQRGAPTRTCGSTSEPCRPPRCAPTPGGCGRCSTASRRTRCA